MRKLKRIITFLLVLILLLGGAYVGLTIWENKKDDAKTPETVITTDLLEDNILSIAEYATLEYRYTNMSKFENDIDFYGWKLPFTNKSFIVSYDGSMKLGIDGNLATVQIVGNNIVIDLPPAKVLSHEIKEDSIVVFDQTKNVFNPIQVEDYADFAVDQKITMEAKALKEGMFDQASEAAKNQIENFLLNLPEIRDNYTITFTQKTVAVPGTIPEAQSSGEQK